MKTIHILGSEGFIGSALQREVFHGMKLHCWSHRLLSCDHHFDLLNPATWQTFLNYEPSHVILLSWPGLPNYQESFHITRNLPACINLIEQMEQSGLRHLLVAGTCYEYGMQNGSLNENLPTFPQNCYSIAKDGLRRYLASRNGINNMRWCWARIFYPIGIGQNKNSLVPSLIRAIEAGDKNFPITSGRQLRDFIDVNDLAKKLLTLIHQSDPHGVFNIGSGTPRSVLDLVEKIKQDYKSNITINVGHFQDRSDEPLDFWADMEKYDSIQV